MLTSVVEDESEAYDVQILKAGDFAFDTAKHKLLSLKLPDMPKDLSPCEQLLYLSSVTDFENVQMVSVGLTSSSCLTNIS